MGNLWWEKHLEISTFFFKNLDFLSSQICDRHPPPSPLSPSRPPYLSPSCPPSTLSSSSPHSGLASGHLHFWQLSQIFLKPVYLDCSESVVEKNGFIYVPIQQTCHSMNIQSSRFTNFRYFGYLHNFTEGNLGKFKVWPIIFSQTFQSVP